MDAFSFLLPFMETCVSLIEVYRENSEVIPLVLELFSLVAENLIVFLDQVCAKLVDAYTCTVYV